MADIRFIKMDEKEISVNLKISESEYESLKPSVRGILLLRTDSLEETLTTGKLGNSNRIMLPKKVMEKYEVLKLNKKVAAKIFDVDGGKFLVIKLEEPMIGIPVFKEETK